MDMTDGLRRNIRLVLNNFAVAAPQLAVLQSLLIIYPLLLDIRADTMAVSFAILVPMIMCMQNVTVTYKCAVGFCSTKKNFYLAGLAGKLLYASVYTAIAILVCVINGVAPFNTPAGFLLLFAASLLSGFLGEFFGILMYKSAVLGFVVYLVSVLTVTFSFAGGLIYFSFKAGDGAVIPEWITSGTFLYGAAAVCVGLNSALLPINWNLFKKTDIKS